MDAPTPFYALCTPRSRHAALTAYADGSRVMATAHFNERLLCYGYYTAGGALVNCGGLIEALRAVFYPHIDKGAERAKKRRWRSVKVQGSTAATGKRVDAQLLHYVHTGGELPARPHKWTKALLKYWRSIGHTLQAAQLPVLVTQWGRLTQADVITMETATGQLWCWEVKTGVPVGATRKNGTFASAPFAGVPCTKYAQWQLQLYYTRKALEESAGLVFAQSRIIQVYGEKGRKEPIIKVHDTPTWIPQPLPAQRAPGPIDKHLLLKRRKIE